MRRATQPFLSAALAAALLLGGCDAARKLQQGESTSCTGCHGGTDGTSGAPPRDLGGNAGAHLVTVGAHTAHLAAGVRCQECHRVPAGLSDPGHITAPDGRADPDRHAEVDLALGRGSLHAAQPAWAPSVDRTTATCSGVYCHGATLGAGGSATAPTWNAGPLPGPACGSCHGFPPSPPHTQGTATGPFTSSTQCAACHPETVDATTGAIRVAEGHHIDGIVDASGGHGDYSSPATHGPQFFDSLAGTSTLDCQACHGATYDGGVGPSCNACHASAGWTGWQTNCSFCHGTKSPSTQAGYSVATHPTWAAPPDAIAQRLDPAHVAVPERTGAHQAHLTGVTAGGLSFAPPFACATCHAVPGDLSHIGGSTSRATVTLSGAGQAFLSNTLGTYAPATGTCATYCHGSAPSPAWSFTGVDCGSCHLLPPSAASGHPSVSSSLTTCSACHPDTMNSDGSLNLASGKHLDGAVDASGMHGDYSSPATHGPRFFDHLAGLGSLDCQACHGATYDGGVGPSCNACHLAAGWTGSWQANCSFCHGARNPTTQAGYAVATHPTWSAPPDAIAQRLDAAHAPVPTRTGAHQTHLTGTTGGGQQLTGPFTCQTCHAVPGDLTHIGGSASRATVALSGAGQANLLASLGTYTQATGTCASYCHGTSLPGGTHTAVVWSDTALACNACHFIAGPPAPHPANDGLGAAITTAAQCSQCHGDTVNTDGTINVAGGLHVNGVLDGGGHAAGYVAPAAHGPDFFASLRGAGADCRGCHGATYDGGSGPSCNACHLATGWTGSWQTNCSFCHGTKDATTQAGYTLASHPTWSAPPDALAQRLDPAHAPVPSRTGAHQAHLTGLGSSTGTAYVTVPFACSTCHAVPADYAHAGGPGRAPVTLVGTGGLPANLGTYSQATGTCTTYCHGSTLGGGNPAPVWQGGELGCTGCHGYAPSSGQHDFHVNTNGNWCADCHAATVTYPTASAPLGTILGSHLDGTKNVNYFSPGSTWDGAGCTSACHEDGGFRSW